MILEYEYLIGFTYFNGSYRYTITEEKFECINYRLNMTVFCTPREIIKHIEISKGDFMTLVHKDNSGRFLNNIEIIPKMESYYKYNKRKSIIEGI